MGLLDKLLGSDGSQANINRLIQTNFTVTSILQNSLQPIIDKVNKQDKRIDEIVKFLNSKPWETKPQQEKEQKQEPQKDGGSN